MSSETIKAFSRGTWRLSRGLSSFRVSSCPQFAARYYKYFRDWRQYRNLGGSARFSDLAPRLFDADPSSQSGGGHYFYQDVWALRCLAAARPAVHHDVGSRLDGFVAQATAVCPVVYWDIRPPRIRLPDFVFAKGSILSLPLRDRSLASISCLHVAEHVGLGLYGDALDPCGTQKALLELQRVLAPGGVLLFSMPVGRERVEFNAQRIWDPHRPVEMLKELDWVEFSAVNDRGEFLKIADCDRLSRAKYACGLYKFVRSR